LGRLLFSRFSRLERMPPSEGGAVRRGGSQQQHLRRAPLVCGGRRHAAFGGQVEFEPARTYTTAWKATVGWRRIDGRGCCRGNGSCAGSGGWLRRRPIGRGRSSCADVVRPGRVVPISSTDDMSNDAEEWMGRCPAHPMPPARGVRPLSSAMGVGVRNRCAFGRYGCSSFTSNACRRATAVTAAPPNSSTCVAGAPLVCDGRRHAAIGRRANEPIGAAARGRAGCSTRLARPFGTGNGTTTVSARAGQMLSRADYMNYFRTSTCPQYNSLTIHACYLF
jgi:hypothetical protein